MILKKLISTSIMLIFMSITMNALAGSNYDARTNSYYHHQTVTVKQHAYHPHHWFNFNDGLQTPGVQVPLPLNPHITQPNYYDKYGFFHAVVNNGSLKANVVNILRAAGWAHVIWDPPFDYNWVGRTKLEGNSIQQVIAKILGHYPLQAIFYEGNHVVLIKTRVLS